MRHGVEIQSTGGERRTCLGGEAGIGGMLECHDGGLMDVDVIRVAVAANRVEGQDHLGFEGADVVHHFARHLADRVLDLGIGVIVIRGAGHAGIAVAEEINPFQTQDSGMHSAAHLPASHRQLLKPCMCSSSAAPTSPRVAQTR